MYGALEAGGTKFVCAVGTGPNDLHALTRFPTTTPRETLARTLDFFREHADDLSAVGIGSFGPVDLDPDSSTYGHITNTPKDGWAGTDVVTPIAETLDVPVVFESDVNAAAAGEHRWGAARDVDAFIYLTIGTGIGGGFMAGGRCHHGLLHPEMGHIRVPRAAGDDFEGACPFHGDCLEGMAAGPAIEARWNQSGETLPPDHPAWSVEAHYLAHALANFICTLSPERIILGGGVMHQRHLFLHIRQRVRDLLAGYLDHPLFDDYIDDYIVPPGLGDRAGVLGALALAYEAA